MSSLNLDYPQQDFPTDVTDEPDFEMMSDTSPENGIIPIGLDKPGKCKEVLVSNCEDRESDQDQSSEASFLDLYAESPILIIITDTTIQDEDLQNALVELADMTLERSWPYKYLYCESDYPPTEASLANSIPPCHVGYLHVPVKHCSGRIGSSNCICSACPLPNLDSSDEPKKRVRIIIPEKEEEIKNGNQKSGNFAKAFHPQKLSEAQGSLNQESREVTMPAYGDYLEAIPEEEEEDREDVDFVMNGNDDKSMLYDAIHLQSYDFVGAMCYTVDDDSDDEEDRENDDCANAPLRWSDEEIVDPERPTTTSFIA